MTDLRGPDEFRSELKVLEAVDGCEDWEAGVAGGCKVKMRWSGPPLAVGCGW